MKLSEYFISVPNNKYLIGEYELNGYKEIILSAIDLVTLLNNGILDDDDFYYNIQNAPDIFTEDFYYLDENSNIKLATFFVYDVDIFIRKG